MDGSPRNWIVLSVSPSILLIEIVLSSEPSASRLSEFHVPQMIALECFPNIGTLLQKTTIEICGPTLNPFLDILPARRMIVDTDVSFRCRNG